MDTEVKKGYKRNTYSPNAPSPSVATKSQPSTNDSISSILRESSVIAKNYKFEIGIHRITRISFFFLHFFIRASYPLPMWSNRNSWMPDLNLFIALVFAPYFASWCFHVTNDKLEMMINKVFRVPTRYHRLFILILLISCSTRKSYFLSQGWSRGKGRSK